MRSVLVMLLTVIGLVGCEKNTKLSVAPSADLDTISSVTDSENTVADREEINKITLPLNLSPLKILDAANKNVHHKYGIEFSGNCYECDLAEILITDKAIRLTNVCDIKLSVSLDVNTINYLPESIEVVTDKGNFLLTEIDDAPVYKLKITGKKSEGENLRIATYFTLRKSIEKFEQHDW